MAVSAFWSYYSSCVCVPLSVQVFTNLFEFSQYFPFQLKQSQPPGHHFNNKILIEIAPDCTLYVRTSWEIGLAVHRRATVTTRNNIFFSNLSSCDISLTRTTITLASKWNASDWLTESQWEVESGETVWKTNYSKRRTRFALASTRNDLPYYMQRNNNTHNIVGGWK